MQYSKEEQQQHLDDWKKSGISQSTYCRENTLKLATFHYWKIQVDKKLKNTAAPFIPTTVVSALNSASVFQLLTASHCCFLP